MRHALAQLADVAALGIKAGAHAVGGLEPIVLPAAGNVVVACDQDRLARQGRQRLVDGWIRRPHGHVAEADDHVRLVHRLPPSLEECPAHSLDVRKGRSKHQTTAA